MKISTTAAGRFTYRHKLEGLLHRLFRRVCLWPGQVVAAASLRIVFIREWLRSPRLIGAVCPSGTALAEAMAAEVPDGHGLVVELGAGTGAVTRALLDGGVSTDRLIAVERSAVLAEVLRRRFPGLTVIEGDAADLSRMLPTGPVDCVVSSIPLVSLPKNEREAVIDEIKKVLQGRRLIQFTYFWGRRLLEKSGLPLVNSRRVLKNLPPARVLTFIADPTSAAEPATTESQLTEPQLRGEP